MNDRLSVARRVLAQAQLRTGMRAVDVLPASEKDNFFEHAAQKAFMVPDVLRTVFPYGIPKAEVIKAQGSVAASALIAGIASQQGAWVVLLGAADVGWDFFLKSGVKLERFVYVPAIETLTSQILFAALDGFDVVLLDGVKFRAREEMLIAKRARLKNALLISNNWNADLFQVHCAVQEIKGLSRGRGHIRDISYQFTSRYGAACVDFGINGWNFDAKIQTSYGKNHQKLPNNAMFTSASPKLEVVK
ncbi:hypothetical protein JOD55_001179 [Arcanobacterium pluranimalium]|uniref:hypothetical protein n=1 Tax=Arcanobacterium pluranimalium TaxID=108028 RepID=UPI00195A15DE|nr:hypothetical protein [Arcanobacterium pluranimalium]MBM7825352.1 hypothetical protein [Arcanobacterium pluranimalium]